MVTLHVEVNTIEDTDFDGNPITFKTCHSTIGWEDTHIDCCCPVEITDEDVKIWHKGKLTETWFVWDNEI
jgi:hypothetical protein